MHVTLRVRRDAQGLRSARVFRAIYRVFCAAREQLGFRLTQYSVQHDLIHLIVEANDRTGLTRGLQGLLIRVALATNRVRARRGRVFAERYHARQLKTPLEARRALLYVLRNDRKHQRTGWSLPPWYLDPRSSAREFDGWQDCALLDLAQSAPRTSPRSTAPPQSFLLSAGWRRHGLIDLTESPRAGHGRVSRARA